MEIELISKTVKGGIARDKDGNPIKCPKEFLPLTDEELANTKFELIDVSGASEEDYEKLNDMMKVEIEKQTNTSWEDIVTDEMIHEYASKQSHEWWQCMMNKWNSLSKEEQEKYNQFIGFNDFSDILMNELIQALKMVTHTRKLVYEEGNLAVNVNPKPCEVVNPEGCKEISDDINDEVIRIMKLNGDL